MKIRSLALGSVAAISLVAGGAIAADLPVRSAAPAPVYAAPIFSWTGFYVGVNAGWVGAKTKTDDAYSAFYDGTWWEGGDASSLTGNGFIGGIQAGYNYQVGAFVLGVETDMAWTSASKSITGVYFDDLYAKNSLNALGTLRARLGFTFDRTLIYATGGLAYGRVKSAWGDTNEPDYGTKGSWQTGWTAGGGVEYAFTNNWTAKIEALYYDLGSQTVNLVVNDTYAKKFDNTGWTVRAGVNYKFGAPAAPVVARY